MYAYTITLCAVCAGRAMFFVVLVVIKHGLFVIYTACKFFVKFNLLGAHEEKERDN